MRKDVRNGAKTVLLALACTALAMTAQGGVESDMPNSGQPYASIPSRNIFGLGPERRDDPDPVAPKPTTNTKLTGITTVLGVKQAFFLVNEPATDGKAASPHSVMLCEGQHFAKLEVLQINPEARTVRVKNDGTESVFCFNDSAARK